MDINTLLQEEVLTREQAQLAQASEASLRPAQYQGMPIPTTTGSGAGLILSGGLQPG